MAGRNEYGFRFNKRDLDRLGIFAEMSYLSGKGFKYVPRRKGYYIREILPGRQMFSVPTRTKSGLQDGYFQPEFLRVFEGEAHPSSRLKRGKPRQRREIIRSPVFNRPEVGKKHSTPGDFHGTFIIEPLPAMDPRPRPRPPRVRELRNFVTRPGKKGGPGFLDITINPYPISEPPKKEMIMKRQVRRKVAAGPVFYTGGRGTGFFTENPYEPKKLPTGPLYVRPKMATKPGPFIPSSPAKKGVFFSTFVYQSKPAVVKDMAAILAARKQAPPKLVFHTTGGTKPYPQRSIVNHNVDRSINITNWRNFEPFVFP